MLTCVLSKKGDDIRFRYYIMQNPCKAEKNQLTVI